MNHPFELVDVFGREDLAGNPLAVVLEADDLSTEQMQRMTRWLNFSETSFVLRPTTKEADYRVRIFTLERELPFAGHPTLGTCHTWLANGGRPHDAHEIIQECVAGLVAIHQVGQQIAFRAPPIIHGGPAEQVKVQEVASALRIPTSEIVAAQWVDNGPGWLALLLRSAEMVLAVKPPYEHRARLDVGIVGLLPAGSEEAVVLRAFFSDQHGVLREDPVTGSLNASVAQWLISSGRVAAPYMASQGACVGRAGRVNVSQDSQGSIWIGGRTTTIVRGQTIA